MNPQRYVLPPRSALLMQGSIEAHESGDTDRAESGYREVTRLHPDFADAWHLLGLLHHQRGNERPALTYLQRAQTLDPDNVDFLLNFARVLRERGKLSHALKFADRAYRLQPGQARALAGRAETLLALFRGDEVVGELEQHLGNDGKEWYLWLLLGQCRDQSGDRTGALDALTRAIALAPADEPSPRMRRAECAFDAARYDQARRDFERVLDIAPETAAACYGLARLEALEGRFEECIRLSRQALAMDRSFFLPWSLIAEARAHDIDLEFLRELEDAASRAEGDDSAWPLHFARGRSWEKLGDYDRAFDAYATGNHILSLSCNYVEDNHVAHARGLIKHVDQSFLRRHAALGERLSSSDPQPIFICGMPRSGTTLLESILASHPQIAPGGEMRYVHDSLKRRIGNRNTVTGIGEWLSQAETRTLDELARGWDHALAETAGGLPHVTDKMPGNYNLLPLIHACYPDAPIIYMKRDARDNCFSCFSLFFTEGNYFSYALPSLAHYYLLHERLVSQWRTLLGSERILEVSYEELVEAPEPTIRRLLQAIDLPWDPRCLEFHKTARKVTTASVYQVRQPLYHSAIGRWRRFERHLGPLLEGLKADPPL